MLRPGAVADGAVLDMHTPRPSVRGSLSEHADPVSRSFSGARAGPAPGGGGGVRRFWAPHLRVGGGLEDGHRGAAHVRHGASRGVAGPERNLGIYHKLVTQGGP